MDPLEAFSSSEPGHAEPGPIWLRDIRLRPSLRARLISSILRRTIKPGTARLSAVTPRVVRASRRRLTKLERPTALAAPAARVSHIEMAGMHAEHIAARGASDERSVLMLHGGGYAVGSAALYRGLAARISRAAACTVVVPDYRLAPEHPFPAALDDALAAWAWMTERWPPSAMTLIGDSAGGGLMLAALAALRDTAGDMPVAAAAIAPWTDLTHSGESLRTNAESDPFMDARLMPDVARIYLGHADPADPRASPLLGSQAGMPPLLIQVSASEVLHDDAVRFGARAHASGVDVRVERWAGLPHVFQMFAPLLPESGEAIAHIGRFFAAAWANADAGGASSGPRSRGCRLPFRLTSAEDS